MQRFLRKCRWLSLVCASVVALLGGVACGGSADTPFSVFNQQPQPGSGAAITPQTANHIHPLWRYQPQDILSGGITSTKGIVYVSYESTTNIVGKRESMGNFDQTAKGGVVSVLDALDSQSGRRLWRIEVPESFDYATRPLVAEDTVYLALTYHVCALNGQSGKLRWCSAVVDREKDAEYILDGEMAYENGLLFLGAYHTLIAVDVTTGKRMWSAPALMLSSHLVAGNHLVYVSALGGKLSVFDARSGKPLWHTALMPDASDPDDPSGNYAPVPLLGDGVLYLLTGRILAAFQGSSGGLLWQVQVLLDGEYQIEEPPFPVVENDGGTAYVVVLVETATSSQVTTELVAYNLHTHKQAWREHVEGAFPQALEVSSGVVYAASLQSDQRSFLSQNQGKWHFWLSLVDIRSGQVLLQLQNDDSSFRVNQLVGGDGHLYVLGHVVLSPSLAISQTSTVYALGS